MKYLRYIHHLVFVAFTKIGRIKPIANLRISIRMHTLTTNSFITYDAFPL